MSAPFSNPLLLAVAFAAFWLGGAAIMSRIAGWHVLSKLFPAPSRLHGQEVRFASISIGAVAFPISYRRCVRVVVTPEGLGLCLMFPFRFYSPPFLVPWRSISGCTEKQVFRTRKVTFTLPGTSRQLTFSGLLGQQLKAQFEGKTQSAA